MLRATIRIAGTVVAVWLILAATVRAADKPMNVIFILADDLGYSDTTLYGTTSLCQTPNLERLAARCPGPARRWILERIPMHREILAAGN